MRYVEAREKVYMRDDYANEVYWIVKGSVHFLYGMAFKWRHMLDGSHFGEYEVIKRKPREFSVETAKRGEFLVMKRSVIDLMSRDYHEVYQNLKKLANERKRRNAIILE